MLAENIEINNKTILVTGAAGFIGSNLICELLYSYSNIHIVGIDNMNAYYDVSLKEYRLKKIYSIACERNCKWTFIEAGIEENHVVQQVFGEHWPAIVVNLAAQAGVRYSIENPSVYISSNIIGFYNILEACRHFPVEHLIYASSSSVYGSNE